MNASDRITVLDLTHQEQNTLDVLYAQLLAKAPRNLMRAAYYDGKNAVRDLGISMPPNMLRVATVLGWSAKSVDVLNRRCNLDGFYVPGMSTADLGIDALWEDNMLDMEAPQVGVSSLIHSAAFLITTQGDVASGEPEVLFTAKDALSGTGVWDRRRRMLSSFLSVIDTDKDGKPSEMVMYMPGVNVYMLKVSGGWRVERQEHAYGVPVEPLVYQPRLGRPFGSSRISRAVMSLHDSALRTVIRSEVSAELFSVPQRVLLGANESSFTNADGTMKSMWQAVLGRVWAIERDEDENVPEIKEFSAASQEPHMSQLRSFAQLFAGETSIPLASLGIAGEANPTSEGAYDAGREDLIREAEGTTDSWSPAWKRSMLRGLQMLHGWDEVPADVKGLRPNWRSPATPSRAAVADAASKTIDKFPWLAETEAGLELFGLDKAFIDRAMTEKRRASAGNRMDALIAAAKAPVQEVVDVAATADEVRAGE